MKRVFLYRMFFSKLFRIAEKVNYEGQVRHERREETNEQQAPWIKQKNKTGLLSLRIFPFGSS